MLCHSQISTTAYIWINFSFFFFAFFLLHCPLYHRTTHHGGAAAPPFLQKFAFWVETGPVWALLVVRQIQVKVLILNWKYSPLLSKYANDLFEKLDSNSSVQTNQAVKGSQLIIYKAAYPTRSCKLHNTSIRQWLL